MGGIRNELKPACAAISLLYNTSNVDTITSALKGSDISILADKPESLSFVPNMDKDAPLIKQLQLGEQG